MYAKTLKPIAIAIHFGSPSPSLPTALSSPISFGNRK